MSRAFEFNSGSNNHSVSEGPAVPQEEEFRLAPALRELARLRVDDGKSHFLVDRSGGHIMHTMVQSWIKMGDKTCNFHRVVVNRLGRDQYGQFVAVADYVVQKVSGSLWSIESTIRTNDQTNQWDCESSGAPLIVRQPGVTEPHVLWNKDNNYEDRIRELVEQQAPNATNNEFMRDINPEIYTPDFLAQSRSSQFYLGSLATA